MDDRAQRMGDISIPMLLVVVVVLIIIVAAPVFDGVDKGDYQHAEDDIVVTTGADEMIELVVVSAVVGVVSFIAVGLRAFLASLRQQTEDDNE